MTVYEIAKKYYPRVWNKERIEALYRACKLTEEECLKLIEGKEEKTREQKGRTDFRG